MTTLNHLISRIEKLQGTAARLSMRLPASSQRKLAQILGYGDQHSGLDAHLQLLQAIKRLKGGDDLISQNAAKSRRAFTREMAAMSNRPTAVASVVDFSIPARSGRLDVRHYIPQIKKAGLLTTGRHASNHPLPLLVFFHGGGFVVGDLDSHDEPCRLLCQQAQVQVLSIDYRLAPEHPSPAAVEDCYDALQWAHAHAAELGADPRKIAIGGDSAGGNLTAVVSQLARGKPFAPVAQLMIYPGVDVSQDYPSRAAYGSGLFLKLTDIDNVLIATLAESRLTKSDPMVSPLLGNLADLPPALLVTAEFDLIRDDGEMYAIKMREAGSACTAYRAVSLPHGFINMTAFNKAAYHATVNMARDFRVLLDDAIMHNERHTAQRRGLHKKAVPQQHEPESISVAL